MNSGVQYDDCQWQRMVLVSQLRGGMVASSWWQHIAPGPQKPHQCHLVTDQENISSKIFVTLAGERKSRSVWSLVSVSWERSCKIQLRVRVGLYLEIFSFPSATFIRVTSSRVQSREIHESGFLPTWTRWQWNDNSFNIISDILLIVYWMLAMWECWMLEVFMDFLLKRVPDGLEIVWFEN